MVKAAQISESVKSKNKLILHKRTVMIVICTVYILAAFGIGKNTITMETIKGVIRKIS